MSLSCTSIPAPLQRLQLTRLLTRQYQHTTEAFLFLIEATPTMLDTSQSDSLKAPSGGMSQTAQLGWKGRENVKAKDAQSKMELALRAALAMMKRKVISNPKDLFGIVVFNTVSWQRYSDAEHAADVPFALRRSARRSRAPTRSTARPYLTCRRSPLLTLGTSGQRSKVSLSVSVRLQELTSPSTAVEDDPESIYNLFKPNEDSNVLASALSLATSWFVEK